MTSKWETRWGLSTNQIIANLRYSLRTFNLLCWVGCVHHYFGQTKHVFRVVRVWNAQWSLNLSWFVLSQWQAWAPTFLRWEGVLYFCCWDCILEQWKMPGCWGYIRDYTTQFCVDYNKPLQGSLLNNQSNGKSASFFSLLALIGTTEQQKHHVRVFCRLSLPDLLGKIEQH